MYIFNFLIITQINEDLQYENYFIDIWYFLQVYVNIIPYKIYFVYAFGCIILMSVNYFRHTV